MTIQPPKIRAIVVDDHKLFRIGLQAIFNSTHPEISIIAQADCGETLFTMPELPDADIILLDIKMPSMGGAEIARRLRNKHHAIKILAISGENSTETIQSMLEAGIDGFISKQHGDHDELAQAIRAVTSGVGYFGQDISTIIAGIYIAKKKTATVTTEFTNRERQIITLCRDGLLCKEIAARLNISMSTVNTHKTRIFQKLGINNTMEMVQYAMKNRIISTED
jgi:DNA-binding NarL/FixJ family response regulator